MLVLLFLGRRRLVGLILRVAINIALHILDRANIECSAALQMGDTGVPYIVQSTKHQQECTDSPKHAILGFVLDIVPACLLSEIVPPLLLQAKQCQA